MAARPQDCWRLSVSKDSASYEERLAKWRRGRFAPPPEPAPTPRTPSLIVRVPMRDGVELYTEIFLPEGTGPFPLILVRSPYPGIRPSRNDISHLNRHMERGYAFAFQLARGQGSSGGRFR